MASINEFAEIKVIGRGSFGEVHAMLHLESGTVVAVKRASKRKCLARRSHLKALSAEMQVLANNDSPYLLQLKSAFQSEDDLFFVLPYMNGGDLVGHFDSLDKRVGKVPEAWIRFYFSELSIALSDLHEMKIVYRDLKPENILIDGEGHIKLCDFGLSHLLRAKDGYMTKGRAGTGRYMAPEVASGDQWYNCSSDMFGLGVVLIWMYEGHSDVAKYRSKTSAKKYTEASRAGRHLIDGLLQPKPEYRFSWTTVFSHPYCLPINWNAFRRREVPAPIEPDTLNWHQHPHLVKLKSDDVQLPELLLPSATCISSANGLELLQGGNSKVDKKAEKVEKILQKEDRTVALTSEEQAIFVGFGIVGFEPPPRSSSSQATSVASSPAESPRGGRALAAFESSIAAKAMDKLADQFHSLSTQHFRVSACV